MIHITAGNRGDHGTDEATEEAQRGPRRSDGREKAKKEAGRPPLVNNNAATYCTVHTDIVDLPQGSKHLARLN